MQAQDLPHVAAIATGTVVINARCTLRAEGEHRVLVVAGLSVLHYGVGDAVAEAYGMVLLVDGGYATVNEVAIAYCCCERTVRRNLERYHEGGMIALATRSGWRPGCRRIPPKRRRIIEQLKNAGFSNREIARRLGLTENAIRKQVGPSLVRSPEPLPLHESIGSSSAVASPRDSAADTNSEKTSTPGQLEQQTPSSGETEEGTSSKHDRVALSFDIDPANRQWDRLLACFGFLDDAVPLFSNTKAVPGAAVLCAVPVLVESGIFEVAGRVYGEIGPAFYGLRTTFLTLLLMGLRRIKRTETLKENDPQALGRVLGLDRAPEVKTMRRKLARLAAYHRAEQLGQQLAKLRVERRGQLMGFLYIDGHVRVYHGKHTLPKAHVARMRLSMPATTDYWVNEQGGDPLLVITASANAGLVKMLPTILAEVRKLTPERRVTVVFDRGGWSPKLFKKLLDLKFDFLTYRKGRFRHIGTKRFVLRSATIDGRRVEYRLHDQAIRLLKGTLRLRQVMRLSGNGHQTPVIGSRWDLTDIEVAYRMFERWRQENFFKYLREEFLLDALVDYQVEPDDPTRTVPNPQRRALDKEIHKVRAEVAQLEQAYGAAAADNPEGRRPTMRGFKIANATIGTKLRTARQHLAELLQHRRGVPQRVEIREVSEQAVVRLATERKHLTNIIKMVAYQAESDLLAFLRPNYARTDDEGRTLLHELFSAAADIQVTNAELCVTINPLSAPHRTLAVKELCKTLTETATIFPGTRLPLKFDIHPSPQIGMAFPGPRRPRRPSAPTRPAWNPKPDISEPG